MQRLAEHNDFSEGTIYISLVPQNLLVSTTQKEHLDVIAYSGPYLPREKSS